MEFLVSLLRSPELQYSGPTFAVFGCKGNDGKSRKVRSNRPFAQIVVGPDFDFFLPVYLLIYATKVNIK